MKRIVVKIGTQVLTKQNGEFDLKHIGRIVDQVIQLRKQGIQVVLVTSGAVAVGRSLASLEKLESETVRRQILASLGQAKLIGYYDSFLQEYGYHASQVLATKEDFRDTSHYENMKNYFAGVLALDTVIPIVNENDTVAVTELMFTDNDELAGLVATQLEADALILLTSTNGVLDDSGKTIATVGAENGASIENCITSGKTQFGRGGMGTKVAIAKKLASKGIAVYIARGRRRNVLLHVVNDVSSVHTNRTLFPAFDHMASI